jgi:hypothetical protein
VRGALPVAVISFHAWQEKYGSDPSVIGAPYDINGRAFSIIGVAPPGFFGAKVAASDMPDMWLPLTTEPLIAGASSRLENPGLAWLDLIGRVRPGTNPRTLEAQLQGELRQWLASHRLDMSAQDRARWNDQTLHLTPGGAGVSLMREQYQDGLRLLLIAAICVLLLACANIANLLLARNSEERAPDGDARGDRRIARAARARGADRQRGARRHRRRRRHCGGLGRRAPDRASRVPGRLGPGERRALDTGVAVRAGRVADDGAALRHRAGVDHVARRPDGRHARIDPHGFRDDGAQKTLAIAQAAVSVVLLSAAAMLGQSLYNLEHQNLGFATDGRYLVSIDSKLSNQPQERLLPLFREIETGLRAFPACAPRARRSTRR